MSNINNNLSYVQEKAKNPGTFVENCEDRYNRIIENIAKTVAENEKIEIINAQGLPGKYTAQAAAESIYKVINKYLKQEEFI